MMTLTVKNLGYYYSTRSIFKNLVFEQKSGECLAITGPNGSGKSTLVRILTGLLTPKSGSVTYHKAGEALTSVQHTLGLVTPWIQLYRDLSALENMQLFAAAHQVDDAEERMEELFSKVGLEGRQDEPLKEYSSGMIQRAKYACALYHQPEIIVLDEPTANLDQEGRSMVLDLVEELRKDKLLIIATNEAEEVELADRTESVVA